MKKTLVCRMRLCVGILIVFLAFATGSGWAQGTAALFGTAGVSPLSVRQGSLGSCYFHSSLAALAKAVPGTLHDAITGDAISGYHVHFFSGPDELVFPEDVDYAKIHGFDHSDGLWVTVIMRAYAQRQLRQSMVKAIDKSDLIPIFAKPVALSALDQSGPLLVAYDRAIRLVVSQDGVVDKAAFKDQLTAQLTTMGIPALQAQMLIGFLETGGFYEALAKTVRDNGEVFGAYRSLGQGGVPVSVLEAFLGKASTGSISEANATSVEEMLNHLHRSGLALVVGTRTSLPATLTPVSADAAVAPKPPDWWVPSHAYTVLDYDDGKGLVTLRNPWGAKPAPDGVFTLPLVTFLQSYQSSSFAEKLPVSTIP